MKPTSTDLLPTTLATIGSIPIMPIIAPKTSPPTPPITPPTIRCAHGTLVLLLLLAAVAIRLPPVSPFVLPLCGKPSTIPIQPILFALLQTDLCDVRDQTPRPVSFCEVEDKPRGQTPAYLTF